jgi:hypothetical protein
MSESLKGMWPTLSMERDVVPTIGSRIHDQGEELAGTTVYARIDFSKGIDREIQSRTLGVCQLSIGNAGVELTEDVDGIQDGIPAIAADNPFGPLGSPPDVLMVDTSAPPPGMQPAWSHVAGKHTAGDVPIFGPRGREQFLNKRPSLPAPRKGTSSSDEDMPEHTPLAIYTDEELLGYEDE